GPPLQVPLASATTTSAGPARPAGVTALISPSESTSTAVAAAPPIETLAGLRKPEPLSVTLVPPAVGPLLGVTEVTVGGGSGAVVKLRSAPSPGPPALAATRRKW